MVFLLLLTQIVFAFDFSEKMAVVAFNTGLKPKPEIQASQWIQIGGIRVTDGAPDAPIGYNDSGLRFSPKSNPVGMEQSSRVMAFLGPNMGEITESRLYDQFASSNYKSTVSGSLATVNAKEVSMELQKLPTRCRAKGEFLLICASSAESEGPVVYYSLFKKTGVVPEQKLAVGASTNVVIAAEKTKQGQGIKCVMAWGNGKIEHMTFTLLSQPAKLGNRLLYGVGGSWEDKTPNIARVLILKIEPGPGSQTVYTIFLPVETKIEENANIDIELLTSKEPRIGTISVPAAGGASDVSYPKMKKAVGGVPTTAQCSSVSAPEPKDPFQSNAGVIP